MCMHTYVYQTDVQTGRQAGRQAGRHTHTHTYMHACAMHTHIHAYTDIHAYRHAYIQTRIGSAPHVVMPARQLAHKGHRPYGADPLLTYLQTLSPLWKD